MSALSDFVKCGKPDCGRKVPRGTEYCCSPCSTAARGRYEIHSHSPGCDERAAERGLWRAELDNGDG